MQTSIKRNALTLTAALGLLIGWQALAAGGAEATKEQPEAAAGADSGPAVKSAPAAAPKAEPAETTAPAKAKRDRAAAEEHAGADEPAPNAGEEGSAHAKAATAIPPVISSIYILMLAGFVGFEVIGRVSPLLHTPLMSATNAISGISLVGSLVAAGNAELGMTSNVLGFIAVTAATINVVGGFMITDRMLRMFKLRGKEQHG
jgi:H+-translocating NAD(P) transhydrogenase subunit alpha